MKRLLIIASRKGGPPINEFTPSGKNLLIAKGTPTVQLTVTPPPVGDIWLNPFKASSAHHRPMGSNAQYGGSGNAEYQAIHEFSGCTLNAGQGFAGGFVVAVENQSSDPMRTVNAGPTYVGGGLPLPMHVRVLSAITLGESAESVCMIHDVAGDATGNAGWIKEFMKWDWHNGSPTCKRWNDIDPFWLGHPDVGSHVKVGSSASGCCLMVGLVRGRELSGVGDSRHISNMTLANQSGSQNVLSTQTVWPANNIDGYCGGGNCTGPIPYGRLFGIPPSVDKGSLGLSAMGGRIFDQYRNYGFRAIDGTGNNAHARGDQDVTPAQRSEWSSQIVKIWPYLAPVLNETPYQSASGGGLPLGVNTAYDA